MPQWHQRRPQRPVVQTTDTVSAALAIRAQEELAEEVCDLVHEISQKYFDRIQKIVCGRSLSWPGVAGAMTEILMCGDYTWRQASHCLPCFITHAVPAPTRESARSSFEHWRQARQAQLMSTFQEKKRFDRMAKTKTLVRRKGDKPGTWRVIAIPFTPEFRLKVVEKFGPELECIYNDGKVDPNGKPLWPTTTPR